MSLVAEAFVRLRSDDSVFKREVTQQVTRDTRRIERQLASTNREFARFGRGALVGTGALGGLGRAAAFASTAFIGGAGLTYALKSTIDAAQESEVVTGQLKNALDNLGISFERNRQQIDSRVQALSQMAGIDDELVTTTFVSFVRRTNDVTEALRLNAIAANVARGRNISLEAAASLVTKASLGMAGQLRRVGIAAREGATATELLNLLQRKFAGSAEAYGKTAAGAQDRFRVALENTQEILGQTLLPTLTKYLNKLTDWLNDTENQKKIQEFANQQIERGEKTVGFFARAWDVTTDAVSKAAIPLKIVTGLIEDQLDFLDKIFKQGKYAPNEGWTTFFNAITDLMTVGNLESKMAAVEKGVTALSDSTLVPANVRGASFVGRPLTPAETAAISLAVNPDDVAALRAQRAQYEKALAFAQRQIDLEKGNTKQWAENVENLSHDIRVINEQLAGIAKENAEKAEEARLAAIENLLPGGLRGSALAPGAFTRAQAAFAARIPGRIRGRSIADISDQLGLTERQREAQLRTQIAEQSAKNEKAIIPFLRDELTAALEHLRILKKIGASEEDQLREELNIAQLRHRIRDTRAQESGFTLSEFFAEAAREQALYGSNVGPGALSGQDARAGVAGAARMPLLSGATIVQNFYGERDAAQAIQQASQAARALR